LYTLPCGRPDGCSFSGGFCYILFIKWAARQGEERCGSACRKHEEKRVMDKKVGPRKEKPDPERMAVLRGLPIEIKEQITGEEAQAFLYKEELPESLLEKLKDYLVPE
jgi:hypothetical protein